VRTSSIHKPALELRLRTAAVRCLCLVPGQYASVCAAWWQAGRCAGGMRAVRPSVCLFLSLYSPFGE
jgi:hypothetical protein